MALPVLGLSIAALRAFVDSCGGDKGLHCSDGSRMTTSQVLQHFVLPRTAASNLSYCELLRTKEPHSVATATVFISHAWRFEFFDVFEALERHFANTGADTFLWIDIFSNNQHEAADHEFDWWSTTFQDAIASFGHVVMVLSPWESPVPFTRAWCLWEIYSATVVNAKFEVAMTHDQEEKFAVAILNDHRTYFEMLSHIDLRQSDALHAEDKRKIFQAVEASCGFVRLNTLVCAYMREWVLSLVDRLVRDSSSEAERRVAQLAKARILVDQNMPKDAQKLLDKLIPALVSAHGERSIEVASSTLVRSRVFQGLREYGAAVEEGRRAVELLENFKTSRPLDLGDALCHLSFMHILHGCYDLEGERLEAANAESLACASRAMALKIAAVGRGARVLSRTHNNLGNALYRAERYDEALESFNEQLAILEAHDALDHPEAADCHYMIGMLWSTRCLEDPAQKAAGAGEKAAACYEKCIDLRIRKLGIGHHAVAAACRNIAEVYATCCDDPLRAVDASRRSLHSTLASSLGRQSPHLPAAAAALATWHRELGDWQRAAGDPTAAVSSYCAGLQVCEEFGVDDTVADELRSRAARGSRARWLLLFASAATLVGCVVQARRRR